MSFLLCFLLFYSGETKDSAKSEMFTFRDGGVQILCKFSDTVWQFKMELRKGTEVLCDLTKTKESGNTVPTKHPKFCQSELSDDGVSFFLNNLDSSHASYYTCQLSIFDPPPFQEKNISREYLNVYGKTMFFFQTQEYVCIFNNFSQECKHANKYLL